MRFALALLGVVIAAGASGTARADDKAPGDTASPRDKGTIGVGLVLGEPTGLAAKIYLKDDQAIQACAGSAVYGGGLQVHADYVFHPWILTQRDTYVMPVYLGPGLRAIDYRGGGHDNAFAMGMRGVVGLLFDFKEIPLDVFVEVAGVLEYRFQNDKGVHPALNLGLGARYYF